MTVVQALHRCAAGNDAEAFGVLIGQYESPLVEALHNLSRRAGLGVWRKAAFTVAGLAVAGGILFWIGRAGSPLAGVPAAAVVTAAAGGPATAPGAEVARVRGTILARLAALKNVSADYAEERKYTPAKLPVVATGSQIVVPRQPGGASAILPPGAGVAPGGLVLDKAVEGVYGSSVNFSFLNGDGVRVVYDSRLDAGTIHKVEAEQLREHYRYRRVYRPDRVETLSEQPDRAPRVEVSEKGEQTSDVELDVMLGLRVPVNDFLGNTWMDGRRLDAITFGSDGKVMEAALQQPGGVTYTWRFDPKLGGALVHLTVVLADGTRKMEITASDFREVQGVMLPFAATMTEGLKLPDGRYQVTQATQWKVARYTLNDVENTADRYHIVCEDGTIVYDARTTPPHLIVENGTFRPLPGKEYLEIEAAERARARGGK